MMIVMIRIVDFALDYCRRVRNRSRIQLIFLCLILFVKSHVLMIIEVTEYEAVKQLNNIRKLNISRNRRK